MRAINYQWTASKMFPNQILRIIVSIGVWASLCPRYCHPLELERSAEVILAPMNTSVDPCEDFYGFACGSYAQNVSADLEPQQIIRHSMLRNISNFLEMNSSSSDPLILHKARTLYRSCMTDGSAQRNERLKSLADALELVGLSVTPPLYEASDNFSYLYTMARSKVIFNMNLFMEPTIWQENSTHVSLFLSKPTDDSPFSFSNQPTPSFMIDNKANTEQHEDFLKHARRFTKMMYVYANKTVPDLISSEFNATFENLHFLDMFLNYVTATTSKKDYEARKRNSPKTSTRFAALSCRNKETPQKDQFNWTEYISILIEDTPGMHVDDHVKTYDGFYMNFIFTWLLCEMGPQERELYMWWKTVTKLSPYSAVFEYKEARNMWCARKVNGIFPHATGLMLVNRSDMLQAMTKIRSMAEEIRDVFNNTITNVTWMSQTEKDTLSRRLMDMKICIGYPSWLNDSEKVNKFHEKYDEVNLVENDFLTNILKLMQKKPNIENLVNAGEDSAECTFKALEVNCYYDGSLNQIAIQGGYLQFPFDGHDLQALDFGSIGTTIGHEISHGFDSFGMESSNVFEENNPAKKESFRRVQCFVDYYRNYSKPNAAKASSPIEDLLLRHARYSDWTALFKDQALADEHRTVDENMSDSNGLKIAYDAYKEHSRKYGSEPSPHGLKKYSKNQLFFLAYASTYCSARSHSSFTDSMDVHSPDSIRVWGVLRNSEDFAETWGCEKGSWMNPNAEKCKIW